jgi:hypothetical protein
MTDTTILEELSEPYLEPDEGAPSVPDEGAPSGSTSTVSDPEEPTDAEPARSNPYKAVEYTPEAIKSLYDIYGSDIEQGLAKQVLNELNLSPQFKGTANYDDVVSGRAKILDMLPIEDSEGFQGKGLSDDQIIRLFSSLRTLGEDALPEAERTSPRASRAQKPWHVWHPRMCRSRVFLLPWVFCQNLWQVCWVSPAV